MRARLLLSFAGGLALLCALAGLSQQRGAGVDPVLSSTVPVAATVPVASAAPVATPDAVPQPDPAWVARTSAAAGIPAVALTAYARATLTPPEGCDLGWTTLAGLGWIESQHGTIGGRTLTADGRSSTPVLGPALDGAGPVAAIRASPYATTLHGDPTWDHAVGPLQFLPSTWQTWGRDGDGDGLLDPFDLDDAAAAAAAYLCGTGYDLATGPGWTAAVRAYNHSDAYVLAVHAAAQTYADRAAG